ncbi:amidohydrolase family protein [Streptomyces mirabilis]|uniref:amidohydrolase family protein n=1 Tax=Streptomyces mirabilis TaxID=68239 RepID=UPI003F69EAD1
MRIDTHAHVYPSDYLDFLADSGVTTTGGQRGLGADDTDKELEARFSLMDRAGVDRQVISASPLTGALPDPHRAAAAARLINDRYVALVDRHPDRFLAFVVLPLPHVDAALAELDRVLDAPGVVGVALTTSAAGRALTDPAFAPVWQELDRRGTVMYLHPAGDGVASPQIIDHHLTWMVGAPVEDTVVAAQLITRGFVTRYPHVRILNSHFGGALPMLLERWDNLAHFEAPEAPLPPSQAARRMWYDTVAHSSQTAPGRGPGRWRGPTRPRQRLPVPGRRALPRHCRLHRTGRSRRRGHPGHPGRQRRSASGTGLIIGVR